MTQTILSNPKISGRVVAGVGLAVLLASPGATAETRADPAAFPAFDIARTCHDQAAYAFAATLGQVDESREIAICTTREAASRALAETAWSRSTAGDKSDCADLAGGRYTRLSLCLSDARGRRSAR